MQSSPSKLINSASASVLIRTAVAVVAVFVLAVSASAQLPSSVPSSVPSPVPSPADGTNGDLAASSPGSSSSPTSGPSAVNADETPDQALSRIVGKVKEKHSLLGVIDDVDWEAAYQLFPVERHNTIINVPKVTGPDDLKAYFEEVFGDPKVRTQKTKARLTEDAKSKGKSTEAASGMVDALEMAFERSHLTIQSTIDMSSFKTGEVRADGDKAQVQLITTRQGMTTVKEVMLIKKAGRWLLAEPSLISTKGQKMVLPEGPDQSIGSLAAPGNANQNGTKDSTGVSRKPATPKGSPAQKGATGGAEATKNGSKAASAGGI